MALPLGAERDPFEIETDDEDGEAILGGKHVLFSTNQVWYTLCVYTPLFGTS